MGSNEAPVPVFNAKEVVADAVNVAEVSGMAGTGANWTCRGDMTITDGKYITLGSDTDDAPSAEGRLKVSGGKIWFDTGSAWEIVTSAA